MRFPLVLPLLALGCVVGGAAAQSPSPAPAPAGPSRQARAVRAAAPPVIDGREDDAAWRTMQPTSGFLEFSPREGKDPRFRTEFKAAYDDRNLYVFVRAFDPHPDSIMTALTRRDVRGPSDQLKVMIDSYHDRRSGFEFAVNPVGVKRDYAMYNDREEDQSWDGVWDAGTRIDSVGWTAEFRIPLSQLRYNTTAEHTFGFAVWRDLERYKERISWPLYRQTVLGISSQLGELTGIRDIAPFRRRELVPFVVAKNESQQEVGSLPGSARWGRAQTLSAGADLKFGLTPNFTVDATVNPDFGQVEADPSVLNLSAFEQFFQERRPFFVEGAGLYSFSQNSTQVNRSSENLFYSRRIGRAPQLLGLYGDEASPTVTPIIGAAKLTGRLSRGMSLGVVEAVTGREGGPAGRTLEPWTSYTVLRGQQEMQGGQSTIGFIGTAVNRSLDQWSAPYLRREAYVAGTDLRQRWGRQRFELNAKLTASLVRGSAQSILATQLNPVHLYQRPDDDLALDPTRTTLQGNAQEVSLAKWGGSLVHWLTSYERQSAGYEVNDLGFLRRANQQKWKNWVGLSFQKPTRLYRRVETNFNFQEYWTADGLRTDRALNANGSVNLANNHWLNYGATFGQMAGSYCDNCARGGPAMRSSPSFSWNVGWQGDDRRRVWPSVFYGYGVGEEGKSTNTSVDPEVEFRLLPQLQMSVGASWNRNEDDVQWLRNITEGGVTHYTFGHLSQDTRSASVRVSYAMTTALTFQLYAQPFVTRGQFSDFRALSDTPRAARYEDRFRPFSPREDMLAGFDVMELRSNSVLRWEFRPGSTMFVVWTHGRSGGDRFRDRPWRDEYNDLFALHPANTFLVKVAYWLD